MPRATVVAIFFSFLLVLPEHLRAQKDVVPGTRLLTMEGDLSRETVERSDRFFLRMVEESRSRRSERWNRVYASTGAYAASVEPNRSRFKRYIGAIDPRIPFEDVSLIGTLKKPALLAETPKMRVFAVSWPVFQGVDGEGLLLEPKGQIVANVVALPDADMTPETLAGLEIGDDAVRPFALRLAASGARVLVPTLISRDTTHSGNPLVRMTDASHREWVFHPAYHLGRHVIGFEVQKVLAAVDWFERLDDAPIGAAGYGEGALLAFYSAALDPRIGATLVSGYFQEREDNWKEPVYREVWGLLDEFGDAEIASLIAPRALIIEASRGPEVLYPPDRGGRAKAAAGRIVSPLLSSVNVEFERAKKHYSRLGTPERARLVVSADGHGKAGTDEALSAFLTALAPGAALSTEGPELVPGDARVNPDERQHRQVQQLVDYTQHLMRMAQYERAAFWKKHDPETPLQISIFERSRAWKPGQRYPLERFEKTNRTMRRYFWEEILGYLPPASVPPDARSRIVFETPEWTGYEIVMDVYPEVINYGHLLIPKDLKAGERRPVVVVQHGHAGTPFRLTDPSDTTGAYHAAGARLAQRGFIVYAPQNLYTFDPVFHSMQRKARSVKQTFWGLMVRQHEQALAWMKSLPFVDGERIGFYGLSYGGKTAMMVPAVLTDYALSICSGDFSQRVWKHVHNNSDYSFQFSRNQAQLEFGIGSRFNYAEIAALIAPRPFMVERGFYDTVSPHEWVTFEYGKVSWLYNELGIGDRTEIEVFDGVHEMNLDRTVDFLHEHLDWPALE